MHRPSVLSRHLRLRATRCSVQRPRSRPYSRTRQIEPKADASGKSPFVNEHLGEPVDPRPKWLFSAAALLKFTLIPTGLVYAVFFHDFGKGEHCFMPPRRWLQKQRESFFTLSPAEKGLVKDVEGGDGEPRTQS